MLPQLETFQNPKITLIHQNGEFERNVQEHVYGKIFSFFYLLDRGVMCGSAPASERRVVMFVCVVWLVNRGLKVVGCKLILEQTESIK